MWQNHGIILLKPSDFINILLQLRNFFTGVFCKLKVFLYEMKTVNDISYDNNIDFRRTRCCGLAMGLSVQKNKRGVGVFTYNVNTGAPRQD
jgi:hypothetical protein